MKNFKAFTIIELLLSLGIVGAIAALTVPSIANGINKRILTNQLKNITQDITFLIDEQLLTNNTKVLANTDFKEPEKFFEHFEVAKVCDPGNLSDCWGTSYKKLSSMSAENFSLSENSQSVKLKNGAVMNYTFALQLNMSDKLEFLSKSLKLLPTFALVDNLLTTTSGNYSLGVPSQLELGFDNMSYVGTVIVDLNGPDAPNIIGRDLFKIIISNDGHLSTAASLDKLKTNCQTGNAASCFTYVMANNWKMDY